MSELVAVTVGIGLLNAAHVLLCIVAMLMRKKKWFDYIKPHFCRSAWPWVPPLVDSGRGAKPDLYLHG